MKKMIVCFLLLCLLTLAVSLPAFAVGDAGIGVLIIKEDMASRYELYLTGCTGHYDDATDTATFYITNTSKHSLVMEVKIGFNPSTKETCVSSGYFDAPKGKTVKVCLHGLKAVPEKANDDLGYVPGSHLGEGSVVRFLCHDAKEGDTFVIAGINSYREARNSSFKAISELALHPEPVDPAAVEQAVEPSYRFDKPKTGYQAKVPPVALIDGFMAFVVVAAILCAGGAAIYIFVYVKRRFTHDGK